MTSAETSAERVFPTYNLLEEQWIPVLWRDGRCSRVSVLEAFEEAHRIREIAAPNPMDRLAILRFLPGVFYRCRERLYGRRCYGQFGA